MKKLLMGVLSALALTACSSEEVVPDKNPSGELGDKDSRFMSISIRNANPGTRAAGDQAGNLYEEGLDLENKVEEIRFYFFKADGSAFPMTSDGKNFYKATEIEKDGMDMPNVEKKLQAVIVLQGDDVSFSDLKSMVAVVNPARASLDDASKSLVELQKIVADYSNGYKSCYNNKSTNISPMLMTSSVFGIQVSEGAKDEEKFSGCEVYINPNKLKTDKNDALGDPIEMYVERVLAKVRVTAKWDAVMDTKRLADESVIIPLKEIKDGKVGDQYTTDDGKKIYAKLIGWGMQSFTEKSYLFKNIGGKSSLDTWNSNLGTWWNDAPNFRSYWAVNPTDAGLLHAKHTDAMAKIGTILETVKIVDGKEITTTEKYDGDFYYTQENAADNVNGLKTLSDYDPYSMITRRSQVYIRAKLVDETGAEVELTEWGGQKYTEANAVKAMFAAVQNQILIRKADGTETSVNDKGETVTVTKYHYESIPLEMVHMVPAEKAIGSDGKPKANKESENSKRYLSYIQLAKDYGEKFPEGFEQKFFDASHKEIVGKSIDNKELTAKDVVNGILSSMPGAKAWRNGDTYYYADLRHLNVTPSADENKTKGGYGVVRNHIYEVELNTIFGLGTPVLIPDEDGDEEIEIIPQKPTPDAFFLGARLNILSWRVVKNGVDFEW